MRKHTSTLLSDFYKQTHGEQYNKDMKYLVSYLTPRKSRLADDTVILFGVQGFIKEYLIDNFNENFFNRPLKEVMSEHKRVIEATMKDANIDYSRIEALHRLGYLPVEIQALPEGTKVPMHVPCVMIRNTHPDFMWVTNFIESIMSCQLWYPMVVATQAYKYREIANKYYKMTVENGEKLAKHAISEFGFRGAEGLEGAILASSAFLTSFDKTATIPALLYLEDYYNCDCSKENVGGGMVSTEHSVMCSNAALDGNESTFLRKLLTELYPKGNISVVCDSYDYWNVVTNIIGKELYQEVMNREGTLYVRGDSGNPVDIICGTLIGYTEERKASTLEELKQIYMKKASEEHGFDGMESCVYLVKWLGDYYRITCYFASYPDEDENGNLITDYYYHADVSDTVVENVNATPEMRGTVEVLWDIFGGTINSKGYKVLNSHIRAIYGDSITPERAKNIYDALAYKGFAACNVALGAGSFSMQCAEENKQLKPFTRDTYSIAVKATYGQLENGDDVMIFKNPKTDTGKFKKSQRGMCYVHYDSEGNIVCEDGYTLDSIPAGNIENGNLFRTVFINGNTVNDESIHTIRNRLFNEAF